MTYHIGNVVAGAHTDFGHCCFTVVAAVVLLMSLWSLLLLLYCCCCCLVDVTVAAAPLADAVATLKDLVNTGVTDIVSDVVQVVLVKLILM